MVCQKKIFSEFGFPEPSESFLRKLQEVDHLEQLKKGNLQVSTIWENVCAHRIGCRVTSKNNCDLSNGDDCKLTTSQLHGSSAVKKDGTKTHLNDNSLDAAISNIKNKDGYLLVQLYEKFSKKFYYFMIPYSAYCSVKSIAIPFEKETFLPKRSNKYWEYEVECFNSLIFKVKQKDRIKRRNALSSL